MRNELANYRAVEGYSNSKPSVSCAIAYLSEQETITLLGAFLPNPEAVIYGSSFPKFETNAEGNKRWAWLAVCKYITNYTLNKGR